MKGFPSRCSKGLCRHLLVQLTMVGVPLSRSPALLKGDANEARSRSTSRSRSRPGSRRGSDPPPPDQEELLGRDVSPSISVSSSLDGMGDHHEKTFDPDILLDKLGMRDLDPNVTHDELQEMLRKHISSNGNSLPTLNERMTEDTMEDSHAFQDLVFTKKDKNSSPPKRGEAMNDARKGLSSKAIMEGNEFLLNTLEEGDDEDEDAEGKEPPENDSARIEVEIPKGVRPASAVIDGDASTASIGEKGSLIQDEDVGDDDDAEVDVPCAVFSELKVSDGDRQLRHRETSMGVVVGDEPDYLEADEMDGLEADRSEK